MAKSKYYNQSRTLDFEISTVISVDIDALRLRMGSMSDEQIRAKIEKIWADYIHGREGGEDFDFTTSIIKSKILPNSLRVSSVEVVDTEAEEDE